MKGRRASTRGGCFLPRGRAVTAGVVVLTVFTGGGAGSGCRRHDAAAEHVLAAPPIEVHCTAPSTEAVDETIPLRGRLAPPPGGDLPVASQVVGRVVDVAVHEGQRITKGTLVASIDDASSRDGARQAEAAHTQAQAAESNANTTLDRTKALVARGIAPKQDLEDAVARAEATRANVAASAAALDLARRTLGRVQVHSSFDGVVTHIWRGAGAIVDGTAATPIVQLTSTGAVELTADATERDLSAIRPGQPVRGSLDATGAKLEGAVRSISSALDPATGLGVVRVALAGEVPGPLGAFGRIVVTTAHRNGVAVLPTAALRGAVSDGAEVAVCQGDHAAIRKVKIGWRDDTRFEVADGVAPTERVAIDHVLGLDDGTRIAEAK